MNSEKTSSTPASLGPRNLVRRARMEAFAGYLQAHDGELRLDHTSYLELREAGWYQSTLEQADHDLTKPPGQLGDRRYGAGGATDPGVSMKFNKIIETSANVGKDPDCYGLGLLPHHSALLQASAIAPEVAMARGYRSVTTKAELKQLGFPQSQRLAPSLLIPIWDIQGATATYQLRPDTPRIKRERVLKYETRAGSRLVLDVPPAVRPQLADPSQPLWITEGARKADSAVSAGMCCVGLLGVWSWRGTNRWGGKAALPDWELIALNGRTAYIVFDSDVMEKPSVYLALCRLKAFLEFRHAKVMVIYLRRGRTAPRLAWTTTWRPGDELGRTSPGAGHAGAPPANQFSHLSRDLAPL